MPHPPMLFVWEDQQRYPTYSVLQINEAGDYLDMICGGLGLGELEAFASSRRAGPRCWSGGR